MGGMRARADRARLFLTAAAVLLGCGALAARPAGGPTAWAGLPDLSLIVVVVVGMIGVTAPVPSEYENLLGRVQWVAAVILGVAAFAAARLLTAPIGPPVTALAAASTVVAAVAEEAFFRRLVYGWLAGGGPALAVVGAAALFAVVHLPAYGVRALPVDLAAGIMFGWQRLATGGWTAPAFTHAAANLLQLI